MAWTAPRTWVAGETVTAALLNTHIRDNLKVLSDAWTTYNPTWTAASTNPVIGNGTIAAAYARAGQWVRFRISINMGSTTTFGTGQWRITLPVNPLSRRWAFIADAFDTSTGQLTGRAVWNNSITALEFWVPGTSAGGYDRALTNIVPFTWANGDVLSISGEYEVA